MVNARVGRSALRPYGIPRLFAKAHETVPTDRHSNLVDVLNALPPILPFTRDVILVFDTMSDTQQMC